MEVTDFFGLKAFPFAARGGPPVIAPPVRAAAAELARHIDSGAPTIVIAGASGTGKSFLLHSLAADPRLAHARPRFVADHSDIDTGVFDTTELLLVDEADHLPPERLRTLAADAAKRDKRLVIAVNGAAPAADTPLPDAPVVAIGAMSPAAALSFLHTHFARSNDRFPFDAAAAERIAAAGGSPRQLKALAGAALVEAMVDGAPTVGVDHALRALAELPRSPAAADVPAPDPAPNVAAAPRTLPVMAAPRPDRRPLRRVAAGATLAAVAVLVWATPASGPAPAPVRAAIGAAPAALVTPPAAALEVPRGVTGLAVSGTPAPPLRLAVAVEPAAPAAATPAPAAAPPPRRVEVVIRYDRAAPAATAEAAYAVAGMLERGGFRVAAVSPAAAAFGEARTLYFDAADRAAADAIGRRLAVAARLSPGPGKRGTVEVWLPS
jgi:hypothetical protein